MDPKTEIENCYPIKSPLSKGVRGLSFPLPLREGARGRGKREGTYPLEMRKNQKREVDKTVANQKEYYIRLNRVDSIMSDILKYL